MTASAGPESMTAVEEEGAVGAVVDRLEERTHYPLEDLISCGGDAERPHLAVGLGDIDPLSRLELEALVAQALDQPGDAPVREAVERLPVRARSHVPRVGPDRFVHDFVQVGLVEKPVQILVRPASIRIPLA